MGISAEMVGNVAVAPTLKTITVRGEERRIAEMLVISSTYRRLDDGTVEQVEGKTFPVQVTIWHEVTAERVFRLIRKGASVVVKGDLFASPWIDDGDALHAGLRIDASSVALNLQRVEEVVFRARREREAEEGTTSREPAYAPGTDPLNV
ncbi:single-stranded DNA-binding protein [Paraburkholderia tropica]|uniref:single-stranded DNA-binding protein n=1 Tax=Paraburkholderia tropica TaxID=92647 RepID=UPI002AB6469B|nr:single-stranded DNA-binding protein [Paraburkholderia tropica]